MLAGRALLSDSGKQDQDNTLYHVICGVSAINLIGSVGSLIILNTVKKLKGEYSSRLLKVITITCIALAFTMLVTPNGYDSDKSALPNTGQCEWQSFCFVLFSEARWCFTAIMFMSEMRKVISDTWPSRNYFKHNFAGWGWPFLLAAAGWICSAGHTTIYGWQFQGRCGVTTTTNEGAIFLSIKLFVDIILIFVITKTMVSSIHFLHIKDTMRAKSSDSSVLGIWMDERYEEIYLRHSLYFRIGVVGLIIKMISCVFELFLVLNQLAGINQDISGQTAVIVETATTTCYGFIIFLILFVMNWHFIKVNLAWFCGDKQRVLSEASLVEDPLEKQGFTAEALEETLLIEEASRAWEKPHSGARDPLSPSTRMMMQNNTSVSPPSPSNTSVQANPLATQPTGEIAVGVEFSEVEPDATSRPKGPIREDNI